MDYVEKRQSNVEYLKTVIAQRQIVIEELQRQKAEQNKQINDLNAKIKELNEELNHEEEASRKQITNLKLALREYEGNIQTLKHETSELQFELNVVKMKNQQMTKDHTKQINKLKNDFDSQKQNFNLKISKLQKNLANVNTHYQIQQGINEDKHKIIEDANRDLRGFANEKQQRMIILQNQQLSNEIQYQSRQLTNLLQKNEKQQQQIKQYKNDLDIHKNIENDLVKRSSLAQNLIKQLNKRIKQLENEIYNKNRDEQRIFTSQNRQSEHSRVSSSLGNDETKEYQTVIAKLKFQLANIKNYNHYLENMKDLQNQKYETLGQIMAHYLQNILYTKKQYSDEQLQGTIGQTVLDINALKEKDLKEWHPEETQIILHLLFAQIKPYLSKKSLTTFPQIKNINVSFVEEQNKEPISLPKIVSDYEKTYDKQTKKSNRFRDIPIDISTKILRSNLREWGSKVSYGKNIPRKKKDKSKSIMVVEKEKGVF